MNFKEYISKLQKYLDENPESAELEVLTSADDEGNGFTPVYFGPSMGHFNGEDFTDIATIKINAEDSGDDPGEYKVNAICVN